MLCAFSLIFTTNKIKWGVASPQLPAILSGQRGIQRMFEILS